MCATSTTRDTTPGKTNLQVFKGCAPSSQCPALGSRKYSVNVGSALIRTALRCCNEDRCNSDVIVVPVFEPFNGRTCNFCLPGTEQCSFPVQCQGDENRCFVAKVEDSSKQYSLLGCTTENVCSSANNLIKLLDKDQPHTITVGPDCCVGNLCNVHNPPGLQCEKCVDPNDPLCSNVEIVTCPEGTMCVTSTTRDTTPGKPNLQVFKGCAPSSQCPAVGSRKYSVNVGSALIRKALRCCNGDKCNSDVLVVPVFEPFNGITCNYCLPGSDQCSSPVQCQGDETRCFLAKLEDPSKQYSLLGCTTENVCSSANNLIKLLDKDQPHTITKGPDCCVGNLCNIHNPPGLQCEKCVDPNDPLCSNVEIVTCPDGTMCVTSTTRDTTPGKPNLKVFKGCAPSSQCPAVGSRKYSVNVGSALNRKALKCCNNDKCNSDVLVVPLFEPFNGITCNYCLPGSEQCSFGIQCQGDETRCFVAKVEDLSKQYSLLGCTTENVCSSANNLIKLLDKDQPHIITKGPDCCVGNLCNIHNPPGLQCEKCANPNDPLCRNVEIVTCPEETVCVTSTTRDTTPGKPVLKVFKGCAPSSQCATVGSKTYSVNLGYALKRVAIKCCNEDKCNSDILTVPAFEQFNGRTCHFCLPESDQCSFPVQCQGAETRCFVAKVEDPSKQYPLLGCTTENVCSSVDNLIKLLDKDQPHTITKEPDCCVGNLCNIYNPPENQCQSCADPSDPLCNNVVTITCPQGTMCVTSTTRDTAPGKPVLKVFKGCAPSSQCPAVGTRKYSVNVQYALIRTAIKCCDTNNCNSETLPVPLFEPLNGRICNYCLSGSDQCSFPVQCQGDETQCFIAKVANSSSEYPLLGCTTENVCSSASNLIKLLDKDQPHTITTGPTCCGTNFCNIYRRNPVGGLRCLTCRDSTDPQCSSVESVLCSSGYLCATASIQAIFPGVPQREIYKGCASSSKCPATGLFTYSTNASSSQSLTSVSCCDQDNCNTETLPAPVLQPENRLTCFACAPGNTACNIIVKCRGVENRCFRATVNTPLGTSILSGCTSANVCASGRLGAFLYLNSTNTFSSQPVCCEGSLCNAVTPPPTPPPNCPQTPACPVRPPCPVTPAPPPQDLVRRLQSLVDRLQNLLRSLQNLLRRLQNFLQNLQNQVNNLRGIMQQLQNLVRQLLSIIENLQEQLREFAELLSKLQRPRRQCRCW